MWHASVCHTPIEHMTMDEVIDETAAGERYAAIETGDGETMIYDRDNPEAWLQSDYAVEVGT